MEQQCASYPSESVRDLTASRRGFVAGLAASVVMGAGGVSLVPQSVHAASRPSLWNTLEINLGQPTKFIPRAQVLTLPVAPQAGRSSEHQQWQHFSTSLSGQDPMTQLRLAHGHFQSLAYQFDRAGAESPDRWAAPLDFMHGGGDCEDFAIAKFRLLREAGADQLEPRLVMLRNGISGAYHAVTAVPLDGEIFILDSNQADVCPQAQLNHYDPICSMNETSLWVHFHSGEQVQQRFALLQEAVRGGRA